MYNFFQNNKLKNKKPTQQGFVVLIAIVVSTLLASIGIFMANIAYKELLLSVSARSTQSAFFAADTAIECALYQDLRVQEFRINSADLDYPANIPCNDDGTGTHFLDMQIDDSTSDATQAVSYYLGSLADDLSNQGKKPYVLVRIGKYDIGGPNDETIIEAWGHNHKDTGRGLAERAIKVTY